MTNGVVNVTLYKKSHWLGKITNNKLRYREEHSASVVLSWCTLWHFSGSACWWL